VAHPVLLWFLVALALVVLIGLAYWELILVEGVHLGPGVVVWLYDVYARRYDGIKAWDAAAEAYFVARPLLQQLGDIPHPLIVDVASGTGRLPLALLCQPDFTHGQVIALERAPKMLAVGRERLAAWPERVRWLRADAGQLPLGSAVCDAVTCLEALEFLPDSQATLRELFRILRPGGLLFVTNRVGSQARLFLGRRCSQSDFERRLLSLGFSDVVTETWQFDYDAVFARKPS